MSRLRVSVTTYVTCKRVFTVGQMEAKPTLLLIISGLVIPPLLVLETNGEF